MRPAKPWMAGALGLALLAWAQPAGAQERAWRRLKVPATRLEACRHDLEVVIRRLYAPEARRLRVTLRRPRLLTDERSLHLLTDGGRLEFEEARAGAVVFSGAVEFERLSLDAGQLALGELVFLCTPRLRLEARVPASSLVRVLRESGLESPQVRVDAATDRLELAGRRPLRLLVFSLRPLIRVEGRLAIEPSRIGLDAPRVVVEDLPGFLAAPARRHLAAAAAKLVDLQAAYSSLAADGLWVTGGELVIGADVGEPLRRALPPAPAGALAELPVRPPPLSAGADDEAGLDLDLEVDPLRHRGDD